MANSTRVTVWADAVEDEVNVIDATSDASRGEAQTLVAKLHFDFFSNDDNTLQHAVEGWKTIESHRIK